ncbi:hypothetical protein [Streptomyces puniciscabiei]|uniref:hypothetical protein n=1 Tax=Streptomyces puniciscabiei TaxID=164348 RepID=UPI0033270197
MSSGELSVVDLARVALRAATEQARKNGGGPTAKAKQPRPTTAVRRDGREPMDLGATIGALITERAWELPAAGASLRERWEAIAPELAGLSATTPTRAGSPCARSRRPGWLCTRGAAPLRQRRGARPGPVRHGRPVLARGGVGLASLAAVYGESAVLAVVHVAQLSSA